MDFSSYPEELKLDLKDSVLTVTLNNPSQRNAICDSIDYGLPRLFWEIDRNPDIAVVVVTGSPEGKAFSAGGDINAMRDGVDNIYRFTNGYKNGRRFMQAMMDCDKPIIAKVNGDAVGLGGTVALFCDIVVAAEDARFGDTHVKIGLAAGDGGAVIWPLNVGLAAAKYFLLTGDLINAREAQAMGLIAKVTTASELDGEVDRIAQKLATGARSSITFTKHLLTIPQRQLFASSVDAGFGLETVSSRLPDHGEACEAFMSKRKPVFQK